MRNHMIQQGKEKLRNDEARYFGSHWLIDSGLQFPKPGWFAASEFKDTLLDTPS